MLTSKKNKLVLLSISLMIMAFFAPQTMAELENFEELWEESGHADATAEAFIHWDDDGEISTRCAKCHSTPGYLDFLGEDGSAAGSVDAAAPIGTTVECAACHNPSTAAMTSVIFPSGAEVTGLGAEARCMQCHQGRSSSVHVNDKIASDEELPDDDTPSSKLSFQNIHYYAAAATLMGSQAMGGYQYDGKVYDGKFAHVEGLDSCVKCHDPHSLEINTDKCATCHTGVESHDDLRSIRFASSMSDYDGDGDTEEGIDAEIQGLKEILYAEMQAYGDSIGSTIVYDAHSYPYWFDTAGERYVFTARMLKAAYNFQVASKDPGAFAHNAKYVIQLLHDSIEDVNPAAVDGLDRDDPGHFAGSKEAFRHWDEDGFVRASCSKCHTATGLPFLIENGVTINQPVSNGLECATCHDSMPEFTRHVSEEVTFPSGLELAFPGNTDSNLCINCHQGRESTVSVNESLVGKEDDTVSSSIRFKNSHYYPAGATLFGTEAKGAYEYTGKSYKGRFMHQGTLNRCTACHDSHSLELKITCGGWCHEGNDPKKYRKGTNDWDGDGDLAEGIGGEVDSLHHILWDAIQDYAINVAGMPIQYYSGYPYYYKDVNGNGVVDDEDGSYKSFTPRLLRAVYNYQFVKKDPGAFAHNGRYIVQILHDSITDLGEMVDVDTEDMIRPEATGEFDSCGDATHPYPIGDLNKDCVVDLFDFAMMSAHWLQDNNPN